MIVHLRCLGLSLLVASTLAVATAPVRAQADTTCLDNRAVQAMIASHQIKTWPAIKALAGISDQYKEVSAVRVCQEGDTPYYVVNVAGPTGESEQLVLNAVNGAQ